MNYKKESSKEYFQTLSDLQNVISANGFRILHIHNVKETLAEKGFNIDEYRIIEICNAKFANTIINKNKEYGVLMPCKIILYAENGKVYLTMQDPEVLVNKFNIEDVIDIAKEVGFIMKKIIDETI